MLQKGFLSNKYTFTYSTKKLFWSLFLGVVTAISIYVFLCFIRLSWRVVFSNVTDWTFFLSGKERYWQNVTFALISFVIGQSIFLYQIFSKPTQHKISGTLGHRIRNDQFSVSFFFFHWFFRVFTFTIFMLGFFSGHELIRYLNTILLLSCAVVFLNSWMSIIQVYKKRCYKYIFISAFVISTGSFLIATTSFFDYEKVDAVLLKVNPPVDLPVANLSGDTFKNVNCSYEIKIFFENEEVVYRLGGKNNKLENIKPFWGYHYRYRMREMCVLVNNQVPIKDIKRFEFFLYLHGIYRVTYIVDGFSKFEKTGVKCFLGYTEDEIQENIKKFNFSTPPPPPPPLRNLEDKKIIKVLIDNGYFIDGKAYNKEALFEFFIKNSNEKSVYIFSYDGTITFQEYITLLATYRIAIDDLRVNEMQIFKEHRDTFYENEAYVEDQKRVRNLYPLMYIDEMK